MHHDVRDLTGWGVFDASGKLISIHHTKLDARIAGIPVRPYHSPPAAGNT